MSSTEQPAPKFPYQFPDAPQATVFDGFTRDANDLEQWGNCLIIETVEDEAPEGGHLSLVRVETNYKPHGRVGGEYPVRLTHPDALRAAAALVEAVLDGIWSSAIEESGPTKGTAVALLQTLQSVDEGVAQLRGQLLADLNVRVVTEAAEDQADEPTLDETVEELVDMGLLERVPDCGHPDCVCCQTHQCEGGCGNCAEPDPKDD